MRPSGSSPPASNPHAITIRSGLNASSAGTTTRSSASRYAPVPEPAGSGTFSVAPEPAPRSRLRGRPGARGVEAVLVQRHREHGGVLPEHGLCAVAVVHVPVHDGDPTHAACPLRMSDPDSHVREEAEAHAEVGERMVAGWTHQRIRVVDGAVEHGVDRRDRSARPRGRAISKEPLPNGASLPASPPRPFESSRMRST